jgi:hypothetical protein
MNHRLTTRLLLAALAAAAPLPTLATAYARVRLDGLRWSLIDLKPDDGMAPWVRFEPGMFESSGSMAVVLRRLGADGQPLPGGDLRQGESWRLGQGQGLFPSIERVRGFSGPYYADAFVGQTGWDATGGSAFSFVYQGFAFNLPDDGLWSSNVRIDAHPVRALPGALQGHAAIELSPFTELRWTGSLRVEAATVVQAPGLRSEFARAAASFELLDAAGQSADRLSLSLDTRRPGSPELAQRQLALSLVNGSAEATHGQLVSAVSLRSATFQGTTPPVPEPAAWALLAGGLGVVGGVAARRRPPPRA